MLASAQLVEFYPHPMKGKNIRKNALDIFTFWTPGMEVWFRWFSFSFGWFFFGFQPLIFRSVRETADAKQSPLEAQEVPISHQNASLNELFLLNHHLATKFSAGLNPVEKHSQIVSFVHVGIHTESKIFETTSWATFKTLMTFREILIGS